MTPASLAFAALLAGAVPAQAPGGLHLVAPPTPATDRLMGFTLRVTNGRVAALPDWPAGWTVSIANDPSWTATVEAHALVGAAALPASELGRLIRLAPPPPAVVADLGSGPPRVSGSMELMRDGELRTVKLRSLRLEPDRSP